MQGDKYILSLSENDDILAMWRAYGENGKGVAIGLNAEKLDDFLRKKKNSLMKKYQKNQIEVYLSF